MRYVIPVLLIVAVIAFVVMFATAAKPVFEVPAVAQNIGQATTINFHVKAKHGLRSAAAFVEQNGKQYPVWQLPQGTSQPESDFNFVAGAKAVPQLQDGKAQIVIEATANGRFKKSARWQQEVNVLTHPPTLSVDTDQHYIYLGMAELATFSVSGNYTEAGVRVGNQTFRAWPLPDGKPGMFSLFAYAWNTQPGTLPLVYAANGAGNDVTSPMTVEFPKKEQPRYTLHDLQIDDRFMQKVVGELDPNGSGDLVTRFVKINNDMRKANNKTLSDLRLKTEPKFLWSQPFLRQAAKTEATFADQRKYIYKGQKIDEQVHLGYDLASTQHDGVKASNDGKVVYAAPLGIYGNCIVVDHGYGLQTIYGHLSRIDVKEGEAVKRGQVMGLTGATGMAGGDHLHFSMQLDGVQIDPKEWWDPHWIKDHVAKRVALNFSN